jgi:hypothetical protein
MGARVVEETPRIALSLRSGEVRDLDPDEAQRVVDQYPEVAKQWVKWMPPDNAVIGA